MTVPISSKGGTPKGFLDSSRPRQMEYADKIYLRISLKTGDSPSEVTRMAATLNEVITSTKGFDLDKLWPKLERKFNSNRPLVIPKKTDVDKAQTALSLFYNVLDSIDQKAVSTFELQTVSDLFADAELHVTNKWYGSISPQEKRVLQRVTKTINNRLSEMKKRFNALVEGGAMAGNPIR
jgi:hypothetical protein